MKVSASVLIGGGAGILAVGTVAGHVAHAACSSLPKPDDRGPNDLAGSRSKTYDEQVKTVNATQLDGQPPKPAQKASSNSREEGQPGIRDVTSIFQEEENNAQGDGNPGKRITGATSARQGASDSKLLLM